jgi:hypothetical protein
MRSNPMPSSGRKNLIRWSQPLSAKACRSSPVKVNRRKLGVRSSIRATRTSKSRNGVLTASAAIVMPSRYRAGKAYLTPCDSIHSTRIPEDQSADVPNSRPSR